MVWYGRLYNGVKHFGRQLGRDTQWLGRQLSTGSNRAVSGIGKAQRVVSTLERVSHNVPVLGQGLHLVGDVLGVGSNVARMGQLGGGALQQLGSGNVRGAYNTAKGIGGVAQNTLNIGKDALGTGVSLGAQIAPFL